MSGSGSSGSPSYVPLKRRRKLGVSGMVPREADVGPSTTYLTSKDTEWSDEGSPNFVPERNDETEPPAGAGNENIVAPVELGMPDRTLPRFVVPQLIDDVDSSGDASEEDMEVVSTTGKQSRDKRSRAPRRRPVLNRGPEYLQCDNDSDIYPSWCTEESIGVMRSHCRIPDRIEIGIPEVTERPWDCPKDFICLYESFFLEGCLWFPLPRLLVTYCFERGLAISQLTTKSICHIVGLLVLGSEAGIEICNRLLEEVSTIKKTKGRVFYVSAKPKFNLITHDRGDNLRGWQRFYFFVKRSDLTVSSTQPVYRRWADSYGS